MARTERLIGWYNDELTLQMERLGHLVSRKLQAFQLRMDRLPTVGNILGFKGDSSQMLQQPSHL